MPLNIDRNLKSVPKKYFKKLLPSHDSIRQNRWVRPFGTWLQHHNLWHLNRRSVAGGLAAGMFGGLVPGPLQMLTAGLLAVLFRVNLPVAMFTTFYTNPFTIVPLYWLAYQLGVVVTGQGHAVSDAHFVVPAMNWDNWLTVMIDWMVSLGKPFAVGLPLLAIILAILGYVGVRVGWRIWVMWQWRLRAKRMTKPLQELIFRSATLADVEPIVALVNSAYRGDSSRNGWTTEADLLDGQRTDADEVTRLIVAEDSMFLLCLSNSCIVGNVHLQYRGNAAYLGMLVIQPGMQGKGTGHKLIQAAEGTAIKIWGAQRMSMYVITLRHELIAFYERRGYRRTGQLEAFPDDVRFGIQRVADLEFELLEKNL